MEATIGDRIIVESRKIGTPPREGEVVEVLGAAERFHYRVRWADGHESVFFPSSDCRVVSVR